MPRTRGAGQGGSIAARASALAQQRERESAANRRQRLQEREESIDAMCIHPERFLEPFLLEDTEFGHEIMRRGWTRIFQKPRDADIEMVKEFYLHLNIERAGQTKVTQFRRTNINIDPDFINELFGIPPVETTEDGISEAVKSIPKMELVATLRTDGLEASDTTHADLSYEAAVWNLLASDNLTPVDTRTAPTIHRYRVIYSLQHQEPIDFGKLMFLYILQSGRARRCDSLVFPHFITELLFAHGFQGEGEETAEAAMLGLQSINTLRSKRQLPRLPNARERALARRRATREAIRAAEATAAQNEEAADQQEETVQRTPPPSHHNEAGPSRPRGNQHTMMRQYLDNQALMMRQLDRMEARQEAHYQEMRVDQEQIRAQQQQLQEDVNYLRDAFRYSTGYQRRRQTGTTSAQQDQAPDA